MTLYTSEVPPVTKEFADYLRKVFTPIAIKPTTTIEEVQHNAGQLQVVEFVLAHQASRSVLGTHDTLPTPVPEKKPNLLHRIYNKIVSVVKKVFHVNN